MPSKMEPTTEEAATVMDTAAALTEGNADQFVVFTLGKDEYGVEILDVREIVRAGTITMIPNAPEFLRGVINLRSKIVCVIDLGKRFQMKREDDEHVSKHILIAEIGEGTFGLLVDEVTDVLRLPRENMKAPPEMLTKKIGAEYLKSIGIRGEKLIIFLNLANVLSEKELIELAKVSEKERRQGTPKKKDTASEKNEHLKE